MPLFTQYAGVWPRSDGFLIFIFFLLYITSIIAYGFFIRYNNYIYARLRGYICIMLYPSIIFPLGLTSMYI